MMGKVAWVAGADRREAPGPKPARLGPTPQVGFPPIRLRRQPPGSSQLWNGGVQRGVSVFPARFRTGWSEVTTCQRLTLQTLRANWLRFSGSIPPLVDLSHNMPTINTTGKLASFWRFSLTASSLSSHSLATDYWPLATVLMPLATVLSLLPHQRGQVVRRLFPAGYCHPPTTELAKTERGPISTSGLSIFSMSPKFSMFPDQAISSDKSTRFSTLATGRSLTIRAWPEALIAAGSRRAGRMPVRRSGRSLAVAQEKTVHGRTDRILGV